MDTNDMDVVLSVALDSGFDISVLRGIVENTCMPKYLGEVGIEENAKTENFFEKTIPRFTNDMFIEHFRMFRESFEILTNIIGNTISDNKPYEEVPLPKKILFSVWVLAKQESFLSTGDKFGFFKSTGHGIFAYIIKILSNRMPQFIKWPEYKNYETNSKIKSVTARFQKNKLINRNYVILKNAKLLNALRKEKPLHSKLEKVKKHIDEGANINAIDINDGRNTALHIAVKKGELEIVKYLIERGARLDIRNINQDTPLNIAKAMNFKTIINLFFDKLLDYSINHIAHRTIKSVNFANTDKADKPDVCSSKAKVIGKSKDNKRTEQRKIAGGKRRGKTGLHGEIYQLKLLMLFLKRGLDHGYNFRLTTEMEQAKKFDDLVFEVTKDNITEYRLLQAKHKADETLKITLSTLLTESDGDYSLVKYFFSFEELTKEKFFEGRIIRDVTVCTNIDFDFQSEYKVNEKETLTLKDVLIKLEDKDDILDIYYTIRDKVSCRYKFNRSIVSALKSKLQNYNLTKLSRRLVQCLLQNKSIKHHDSNDIFRAYHGVLGAQVIDVKNKKFFDGFLKGESLDPTTSKFREAFIKEIKKQSKEKLCIQNINEIISNRSNELKPLNLSKNFGNDSNKEWPINSISNKAINNFLEHLVFAVNQPNEIELGDIIKYDIGREYDFATTDAVYNKVFIKLLDFVKDGGDTFISNESGKAFFDVILGAIYFNVKDPIPSFTGRDWDLHKLKKLVEDCKTSHITCVSGMGGVGKSELIRKYIHDNKEYFNGNVIWINAENYSTLVDSFYRLAQDVLRLSVKNIDGLDKNIKTIVQEVYEVVSKRKKSLFVFDNAEKFRSQQHQDEGIMNFLPPSSSTVVVHKPFVIITSRNRRWEKSIKMLALNVYSETDSIIFIKKSLNILDASQDNAAKQLAHDLQNLPLALEQAVAFIKQKKNESNNFSIKDYLEIFNNEKDSLNFDQNNNSSSCTRAIYVVWDITMSSIKRRRNGENAIEVLNIMSYLSPNEIPVELFFGQFEDDEVLASVIELLRQFSMVTSEEEHTLLIMHRLVQQVTRLKQKENGSEKNVINQALMLLKTYVLQSNSINSIEYFVLHIVSLWNHANSYTDLVARLKDLPCEIIEILNNDGSYEDAQLFGKKVLSVLSDKMGPQSEQTLQFQYCIAQAYYKIGDFGEAFNNYETVYKIRKLKLGATHVQTLQVQHNMVSVLVVQHKYQNAYTICLEVYNLRKQQLGADHPDTIESQHNLALILNKQCKYEDSIQIYEELLRMQHHPLDSNNQSLLDTQQRQASVYKNQGKYEKALEILEDVLSKRKTLLGFADEKTLATLNKIAKIYVLQQKYSEAHLKYKELHTERTKSLGTYHKDTLKSLQNIAVVYLGEGRYSEALTELKKVLQKQNSFLGPRHKDTLQTQQYIAAVYVNESKYEEGLLNLKEVYKTQERFLGSDHKYTLQTLQGIAIIYHEEGKYDEAVSKYQTLLKKQESSLGINHRETMQTQRKIAVLHQDRGNYTEALSLLKKLFQQQQQVLGSYHEDTLETEHEIGAVYQNQGKYTKALSTYERVIQKQENTLGQNHKNTLQTLQRIAVLHDNQKNSEAMWLNYENLLNRQIETLGSDNIETLKTMYKVATIFYDKGDYTRSLKELKVVYTKLEKLVGPLHKLTIESLHGIVALYIKQNNYKEALVKYEELANKQELEFGPYHQNTLETWKNIGAIYSGIGNYTESLLKYEQVLKGQQNGLGVNHKDTFETIAVIANLYNKQGNIAKALFTYEELLSKQESVDRNLTTDTLNCIAAIHLKQGKNKEAILKYRDLLDKQENIFGRNHKKTLKTLFGIAVILLEEKKYGEALSTYKDLLKRQESTLGLNHEDTFETEYGIGLTYLHQRNYEKSIKRFKDLLKKQENMLGVTHEKTLKTLCKVASIYEEIHNFTVAINIYKEILKKQEIQFGSEHKSTLETTNKIASLDLKLKPKNTFFKRFFKK